MLQQSIEVMTRYYPKWELFKKCGEIIGFHPHEVNELLNVYRVEVDDYYHFNRACAECFKEFFIKIFSWYDSRMEVQQVI